MYPATSVCGAPIGRFGSTYLEIRSSVCWLALSAEIMSKSGEHHSGLLLEQADFLTYQ